MLHWLAFHFRSGEPFAAWANANLAARRLLCRWIAIRWGPPPPRSAQLFASEIGYKREVTFLSKIESLCKFGRFRRAPECQDGRGGDSSGERLGDARRNIVGRSHQSLIWNVGIACGDARNRMTEQSGDRQH
jgi:hypothetical protein